MSRIKTGQKRPTISRAIQEIVDIQSLFIHKEKLRKTFKVFFVGTAIALLTKKGLLPTAEKCSDKFCFSLAISIDYGILQIVINSQYYLLKR